MKNNTIDHQHYWILWRLSKLTSGRLTDQTVSSGESVFNKSTTFFNAFIDCYSPSLNQNSDSQKYYWERNKSSRSGI